MKDKKNIILAIFSILIALILIGELYIENNTDGAKFKKEYERLNGQKSDSGKTIRSITIPKNNKIVYATEDDIVKMINKKETFLVYFGFSKCPWCRSVINNLLKAAQDANIDKIYYVDVLNIRDTIEYKDGKLTKTKEGTKGYRKLLESLDNVLSEYKVTDNSDNEISTGEKRIYAPNVVAIVKGKPEKLTEGISKKQKDPYMKLTKSMNKESYNSFKCIIKCLQKKPKTCDKKKMC